MKKKQIIALFAAATVLTGTLTGCGASTKALTSENCTEAAPAEYEAINGAAPEYAVGASLEASASDMEECEEEPIGDSVAYEAASEGIEECADVDYAMSFAANKCYSEEDFDTNYRDNMKNADSEGSYLDDVYGKQSQKEKLSEEYSELEEIGFKSVRRNPKSTFAADVDTASYSNLRRMLYEGYTLDELPEGSVRIEELLNYFSYDYKNPTGKEPFGVTTVMGDCPWNDNAKLLSIGLKTEDIDFADTPASNLVFLIDVSGSMFSEDKLPLLIESFVMLSNELSAKDRVSIVTYAGCDSVVLEGVRGNDTRKIKRALLNLEAGGSTNGSAGIETAYELAQDYFIEGGNNRVILATDGDLNVGLTSVGALEDLISEKKETGIFLSVLGFGTGNIKDNKMETLADKGNGNYAYIDSKREAKKVLVKELSANMLTVCKDVKLQVEFNPEVVKGYRLVGYANRVMANRDFNDDTKDGGEIGAGHMVTALYELIIDDELMLSGKLGKRSSAETVLDLNIRFKRPSADDSELLTYPITTECYSRRPGDDYVFQSAVAEYGLLASHSEYAENANLGDVEELLESVELNDEYKEEFYDMVRMSV